MTLTISPWLLFPGIFIFIFVGGFVASYVLAPLFWIGYAHLHPALDSVPGITLTSDDHPGDPLNIALIGTQADLERVMKAAGWHAADRLSLKSDVRIAEDTVLKRPYETAPVSNLFLFGRKEDLAFEQPVGDNPRQRHHVRFWKANELDDQGRPLWIGAATFDERVGLSHTTGQITHHISGDVDQERDHVLETLVKTGELQRSTYVDNFHQVCSGKNGGGDLWKTDGRLAVAFLSKPAAK